ncbi:hypothetical protein CO251_04040 [Sulfobacillus sp. hq2]|nr:hypothetical protein CO251_04040 [Sulfobacillus sp. hq2]
MYACVARVHHADEAMIASLALVIATMAMAWAIPYPTMVVLLTVGSSLPLWFVPVSWIQRLLLPAMLGIMAGGVAMWAHRAQPGRITAGDGFLGFGLFLWTSFILSISLLTTHHTSLSANLPLLLTAYLLTPPTEWFIVFMILRHRRRLSAFIAENYAGPSQWPREIVWGLATGGVMTLLVGVLVSIESQIGHVTIQSNNPFVYASTINSHPVIVVAMALAVIVMAPLAEEALFRGILFGSLRTAWGFWWANLTAAAVFGAAHMDPTLFIPLMVAGMMLNVAYVKTRSLVTTTIAHALLNGLAVFSALFAVR